MICPNCGRETEGKFCPFCGAKLTVEAAAPAVKDEIPQDRIPAEPTAEKIQEAPEAPAAPWASNPGYAQNQNDNPTQNLSGYSDQDQFYNPAPYSQAAPQADLSPEAPVDAAGQTPAGQLIRRVASSPLYLVGALLFTLSVLYALYVNARNLFDYYDQLDRLKGVSADARLIINIAVACLTLVLELLMTCALWRTYFSARSKRRAKLGTCGLTFYKLLHWVAMILACAAAGFAAVLLVINFTADSYSTFFKDSVNEIADTLLNRFGVQLPKLNVDPMTYRGIFLGAVLAVMVLAAVYAFGIVRSLSTAKRVVRTGQPDDRVSVFAGLLILLDGIAVLANGVRFLVLQSDLIESYRLSGMELSGTNATLYGINLIVSGAAACCFAIVLFKFRSAMRSLGVRKGRTQDSWDW